MRTPKKTKPIDEELIEESAKPKRPTKTKPVEPRLLTFNELWSEKGLRYSRMTLWRKMYQDKPSTFPLSVTENGRIKWHEDEVDAHKANLPRGRGSKPGKKVEGA